MDDAVKDDIYSLVYERYQLSVLKAIGISFQSNERLFFIWLKILHKTER